MLIRFFFALVIRPVETLGEGIRRMAGDDLERDTLDDGIVATRLIEDIHSVPGLIEHAGYGQIRARILRDFRVIDLSRRIAREATELRKSRRVRLPGAVIWATARHESALLITRNTKDFPAGDPGIRIPYRV